ncbi:MAG: nrtB [Verrucomicrobiaceae bacterium]|nr:nrtB [Verrucomicrobiaceae bacterium]
MKNILVEKLPAWIFFFLIIAIWQTIVAQQWVPSYLLPSPREIIQTTIDNWTDIGSALLSTLLSIVWGLGLSFSIGVVLAITFFAVPLLRKAVLPFCIFFQTVPIIAIAPLLVIWFGFGQPTVKASAFIVSLFPILANTLTGLQQTDPQLKELFSLYKPNVLTTIFKLQIPSALPYILAGLRIAVGLSVIGAIVGEFIAGGGLGSLIDSARTQQRVDLVFSGVMMSSVLALALIFLIDLVTKLLLGKRPYLRKA